MVQRTFQARVEANPRGLNKILTELTRREAAQRLRRAGEESLNRCNSLSLEFEERYDDRRRNPGTPHLANSFDVRYVNLSQASAGQMQFDALSTAPSFLYLEFGTPRHDIPPAPGGRLAWPGLRLPIDYVVNHPGSTKWKGQWRRAIATTIRDRFPGISIPHY